MKFRLDAGVHRVAPTLGLLALTGVTAVVLSACSTLETVHPTPSLSAFTLPAFDATRGAEGNQGLFTSVIDNAVAQDGIRVPTQTVLAKLEAAGFPTKGMQYSDDYTAVGMKPDSVTVAVEMGKQCLIAQYGHSIGGVSVSRLPALASGDCLLGANINTK